MNSEGVIKKPRVFNLHNIRSEKQNKNRDQACRFTDNRYCHDSVCFVRTSVPIKLHLLYVCPFIYYIMFTLVKSQNIPIGLITPESSVAPLSIKRVGKSHRKDYPPTEPSK